ncbi:MAG: carbohydrate ABC transporter permease [Clostridia bacterium]|nr:carbohydrate ABC transporter permease [Clostridia bacterium]
MVYKPSIGEKIFNVFNIIFMAIMIIITIYPFWYCITCSLSKDIVGNTASLMLWPKGLDFAAYKSVLSDPLILNGYKVTIFVVVVATIVNLIMTTIAAFLLTRRSFAIRGFLTWMMLITMYFSGGMIPTYIIYVQILGLENSLLALILPGAVSVYNMIVMRTNFDGIPKSLEESVKVDGGNDMHVLWHIIIPLSKAVISVMVLFYGVGHWNAWFNALLYIKDREKIPLQLALRSILIQEQLNTGANAVDNMGIAENIKFATIIVATVPILLVYPFIQKYFVKGVMIGAVKG